MPPSLGRDHITETFDIVMLACAHLSCDEAGEPVLPDAPRVTTKQVLPTNGAGMRSSKKWPMLKAVGRSVAEGGELVPAIVKSDDHSVETTHSDLCKQASDVIRLAESVIEHFVCFSSCNY